MARNSFGDKRISAGMLRAVIAAALITISSHADAKRQRSTVERHAFVKESACPSTGRNRLPCPGFQIDHIIPLCDDGADHRNNMQWLSIDDHKAKTRADVKACRARR